VLARGVCASGMPTPHADNQASVFHPCRRAARLSPTAQPITTAVNHASQWAL
jgi:hypothetical protein